MRAQRARGLAVGAVGGGVLWLSMGFLGISRVFQGFLLAFYGFLLVFQGFLLVSLYRKWAHLLGFSQVFEAEKLKTGE